MSIAPAPGGARTSIATPTALTFPILAPRTPREHAKILAALDAAEAAGEPANDNQAAGKPRPSETPRHRALADQLRPLRYWAKLAKAAPSYEAWDTAPANDNGMHGGFTVIEPRRDNDGKILSIGAALSFREAAANDDGGAFDTEIPKRHDRIFGDKLDAADLLALHDEIGDAEFKRLAAKEVWACRRGAPNTTGATYGDSRGAAPETRERRDESVAYIRNVIGGTPPRRVKRVKRRDPAPPFPADLREFLRECGSDGDVPVNTARARHGMMAVANDNRPAFPYWPVDPRLIFMSCRVRGNETAQKGVEFNDGVSGPLARRQERGYLRAVLEHEHLTALDAAIAAANFREVGEALGYVGKNAERRGKQAVLDACAEAAPEVAWLNGRGPFVYSGGPRKMAWIAAKNRLVER